MPRQARVKSESGIYHIMLRGINQQQIFEEDEDSEKFLQVVVDCKAISEFKLFAYCLMSNHIHLLIKEKKEPLEQIFKRICGRYVYWYNIKYQRAGHLFQDRFKSEPVEDEKYFFTVLRYIHQNPLKANMCKKLDEYKFSSFNEYADNARIVDSEFVFQIMSREEFIRYSNEQNSDKCLDEEEKHITKVTDEQARKIIEKYSKCKSVAEFQKLDSKKRDEYIAIFKQKGLSIRQICRLTGVSFGVVRKKIS